MVLRQAGSILLYLKRVKAGFEGVGPHWQADPQLSLDLRTIEPTVCRTTSGRGIFRTPDSLKSRNSPRDVPNPQILPPRNRASLFPRLQ